MKFFCFMMAGMTCFCTYAQGKTKTDEVRIDEVTLNRDREELKIFSELVFHFETKPGQYREDIISSMQREVSQLQRKLSAAKIEAGKSKAEIATGLDNAKGITVSTDARKQLRKRVRALKDDQKDLKKLDKLFKVEEQLLRRFISGDEPEKSLEILQKFEETMGNDVQWTRNEVSEDRSQSRGN